MNIAVCLKQVPGTTEVKINPETNTLIRQGIKNIINPFDSYALEEGVRLKEKYGGKVTAISMGPAQAVDMLKEAISLGADEAVLLSDKAFAGADTWATAYTLAGAVKKLGQIDLVICGRQSTDGDTAQVGPEMAEMLGAAFVAYVGRIEEIAGSRMRVKRMIDEGHEHGCECKTCRPDLWKLYEADWGKLTEAVRHAAFDHQTETHNRNEIWENYQLAEERYAATAKRLDEALKALAQAVKQLEREGQDDDKDL